MLNKIRRAVSLIKMTANYPGSLQRKFKYLKFIFELRKKGIVSFRLDRVADLYTKDWFDFNGTTKEQKKWAYSHGFSSYKMAEWYGITKENYKDFISDFDFYAPNNYIQQSEIVSWFEHKLNTYYLLSPFKDFMPTHYYYVYKGCIMPLDVKTNKVSNVTDVISLIKEKKSIAAKACFGGHGVGFYKFDFRDGIFYSNNKEITENELAKIISCMECYIITDFVIPHPFFQELCGKDTFAVMRVITVFDPEDGPQITCSAIRLGCKKAGITTDHEGTIYCGLSLDKGVSFKPLYRKADNLYVNCEKHPDTDKSLVGFTLPNNDKLRELVISVSRYLPMTPYLVMDIIPTENGFSILEINSHGQVANVEPFYPFAANKYNKRAFNIK